MRSEIVGTFIGDESRELAGAGRSERQACRRTSSGWNGAFRNIRRATSGADLPNLTAEQLEEVRARADAGDPRAAKMLEALRRAGKAPSSSLRGDAAVAAPSEKQQLAALAQIKQRAAGGDADARRQASRIVRQVRDLRRRAAQGDATAARAVALLEAEHLFDGEPAKL